MAWSAVAGLCRKCLLRGLMGEDRPTAAGLDISSSPIASFGDYELLTEIARGGMGVVYKARLTNLNRIVALKMIQAGRLATDAEVKRFRMEAEAAAHLEHPNIVTIYGVGEHEGLLYFTMRFIDGPNLAQEIARHPSRFAPSEIASLLIKVSRAVHYAHQRGILHRDLKPANILIDAQGEPHITDYGLAKQLESASDLTLSGAVIGTPNYMAPEQAAGKNKQVTTASDVYSLGAIFYELLVGCPPFHAETPLETMRQVVEQEPRLPPAARIDRDLETICLKCLQKSPAQRYASAEALAEDLERWLRREPIRARPSNIWEHGVKWAKRYPARAGVILLAVLAPAIVIVVLIVSGAKVRGERNVATAAMTRAEAGERAARERAYAADIYATFQALAVDNLALARRLLNEHRPQRITDSSQLSPDLRGFEWRLLWERSRGQEDYSFTNLTRPADCLLFAPDGRTLISGGDDGIYLWDIVERRPLGLFPGPDPGVPPDDPALTIEKLRPLLDVSPAVVEYLKVKPGILDYLDAFGHTHRTRGVTSLALTPDGNHLLVGSVDFVRSWNFATRAFDFAIPESHATVAVPAAGDLFVMGNNQLVPPGDERESAHPQSALVYSFTQRGLVATLPGYGWQVAVSPDSQLVAAASRTKGLVLWHPATGETETISKGPWYNAHLAFSPDGKTLFTASDSAGPKLTLWDVASKRIRAYLQGDHVQIETVAWSPVGGYFAGGGRNQTIQLWWIPPAETNDVSSADTPFLSPQIVLHGHEATVTALAFSPDGQWLASGAKDDSIRLWAVRDAIAATDNDSPILQGTVHEIGLDSVTGCLFGRAGRTLALWSPNPGPPSLHPLAGTENHLAAGFLAHGAGLLTVELATNGAPTAFEIRRLPDGAVQTRREMLPPPGEIQSKAMSGAGRSHLAVAPNGQWFAIPLSFHTQPYIHVYSVATGGFITRLKTPLGHFFHDVRVSPDGRWLIVTEHTRGENTIAVFDTSNWQLFRAMHFRSAGDDVMGAAIDPTSRLIATGGPGENSIRIWELQTGRLLGQCNGSSAHTPVWSPDGRTLVTHDRGSLKFWSTTVFRELAALPTDHVPLGFIAEGRALVTINAPGEVKTWSPPTLAEIDATLADPAAAPPRQER